jgi:hypothetical protein
MIKHRKRIGLVVALALLAVVAIPLTAQDIQCPGCLQAMQACNATFGIGSFWWAVCVSDAAYNCVTYGFCDLLWPQVRDRGRGFGLSLLFILLCLTLCGQAALPTNYVGIGAGYNGGTIPNLNVTASFATLITKSAGLYSFTSGDYYSARTKPYGVTSSLRTGIAMVLRNWQRFTILEMFNAGAAGVSAGGIAPSLGIGAIGALKLPGGWALAIDIHEADAIANKQAWTLQSVFQVGHVW